MTGQTITGFIKKLLVTEGFGFITAHGVGDVFFHRSQCASFGSVHPGDLVSFEVVDTHKGKAAKNVTVATKVALQQLVKPFVFTKSPTPKHGSVVAQERIVTRLFSSPSEGRAHVEALAKQAGCNAVLGLTCHKETVQLAPNYYGTMHRFSANIAVLVEEVVVTEAEFAVRSDTAKRDIEASKRTLENAKEARRHAPQRTQGGSAMGWVLFLMAGLALCQFG